MAAKADGIPFPRRVGPDRPPDAGDVDIPDSQVIRIANRTDRVQMLRDLDEAILTDRSFEEIAPVALQHVRQVVACSRASILLFDQQTGEARLVATVGGEAGDGGDGGEANWDASADFVLALGLKEELSRGQTVAVADLLAVYHEPVPPVVQKYLAEGLRSFVALPFIARHELIGSLNMWSERPGLFQDVQDEAMAMLQELAHNLAIAVRHAGLLEQIKANQERFQALSRKLLEVQENERRYIARELHDEIGQVLTAVKINLGLLRSSPQAADLGFRLDESIDLVERALHQVHNLSLDLRPAMLDDLGLVNTLRWYLNRYVRAAGLQTRFVAGPIEEEIPPHIASTCFRVAQEALTNVVRHSGAERAQVSVRIRKEILLLAIRDNGAGFDTEAAQEREVRATNLGLLGMQERVRLVGGQLSIESSPAQGTTIRAWFPLSSADAGLPDPKWLMEEVTEG